MCAAAGGFQVGTMALMVERLGCGVDEGDWKVGDVLAAGVDAVDWIPVHSHASPHMQEQTPLMAACNEPSSGMWECAHYRKPGGTVEVWCMLHDDGMERVRCVVATNTTISACGHSHVMMRMMGWMMWNAGGTDECSGVPGGP